MSEQISMIKNIIDKVEYKIDQYVRYKDTKFQLKSIILSSDGLSVMLFEEAHGFISTYISEISPWVEPKPKIQRAFFTYEDSEGDICLNICASTKRKAEEWCKLMGYTLVDWPANLSRVFTDE